MNAWNEKHHYEFSFFCISKSFASVERDWEGLGLERWHCGGGGLPHLAHDKAPSHNAVYPALPPEILPFPATWYGGKGAEPCHTWHVASASFPGPHSMAGRSGALPCTTFSLLSLSWPGWRGGKGRSLTAHGLCCLSWPARSVEGRWQGPCGTGGKGGCLGGAKPHLNLFEGA